MNRGISLLTVILFIGFLGINSSTAQVSTLDSLRSVVQKFASDSLESDTNERRILSAYLYQAQSNNSPEDVIYAYQQLASVNYRLGNINQALKFYKLYVIELEQLSEFEEYKDQQFEKNLYENEIKALKVKVEELEEEAAALKEDRQENYNQNYIIYIGLRIALGLAIALLLGWLYQQYRKSKKIEVIEPVPQSNNEEMADLLKRTKSELIVAETNLTLADILVQNTGQGIEENFESNKSIRRKFVYSQAKGLSTGAGLFLHTVKNNTIIAVFNSANTGASGGLLNSQIYLQLDEIVKNLGVTSPSLILEQLQQRINNIFPAGVPFTGGIACGICHYNNSDRTLNFCGSGLDLFEVSAEALTVHDGFREPLLIDQGSQFENNVITLTKGNSFYMSTESYWKQEGGQEFKPLGRASFEKTITSIQKQPIEERQLVLSKIFEEWTGGNDQFGDVLVFGFIL